jgi:hypothetical protein
MQRIEAVLWPDSFAGFCKAFYPLCSVFVLQFRHGLDLF